MSDRQWSGIMLGDEAYAGSRNFYHLRDTVEEYYSYKLYGSLSSGPWCRKHPESDSDFSDGDYVPGNMYFTTTRLHQELAGATFVDVIIDEAHDADSEHPFKGNVDFDKLDALVKRRLAQIRSPTFVSRPASTWRAVSLSRLEPTCKQIRAHGATRTASCSCTT